MEEVLAMKQIVKIYENGFTANRKVDFSVYAGEIHALLGENGAGKTTLMKVLFGLETCQEGEIYINGRQVMMKSPHDALRYGIGMIQQNFELASGLSVCQNILLGMEPMKHGILDMKRGEQLVAGAMNRYGLKVDIHEKTGSLNIASQQKVEILKALIRGVKILIFDEPTAVLTPQETKELFCQLRGLKEQGYAIIFITHKLKEVMEICDRATIMRHGEVVAADRIGNLSERKISEWMIGGEPFKKIDYCKSKPGPLTLEVRGLTYRQKGRTLLQNISLRARQGEIVGITGIEGNGQHEILELLSGMDTAYEGSIHMHGRDVTGKNVLELRRMGIAHIPEDRMNEGASVYSSVKENLMANTAFLKGPAVGFLMKKKKIDQYVQNLISRYQIQCVDAEQPLWMLSGGNIQKVIIARECSQAGSRIMLADQPTRGVDVHAAQFIRETLNDLARREQYTILLVSSDLSEIMELSDRILVMHKGRICACLDGSKPVSETLLGEYMLGIRQMSEKEIFECEEKMTQCNDEMPDNQDVGGGIL